MTIQSQKTCQNRQNRGFDQIKFFCCNSFIYEYLKKINGSEFPVKKRRNLDINNFFQFFKGLPSTFSKLQMRFSKRFLKISSSNFQIIIDYIIRGQCSLYCTWARESLPYSRSICLLTRLGLVCCGEWNLVIVVTLLLPPLSIT